MGAMRGKVPVMGVWRGDAGEFEPESEDESEPETDSERRRPSMGIGSEWGALLFSMGMAGVVKQTIYSVTSRRDRDGTVRQEGA